MMQVRRADILRYVLLPQIGPRARQLFGAGFALVPYFMALVFRCVRLFPASHPYVNPVNIGRFGVRHVVAEAANHLIFSVRNIDQIVMFLMVLSGLVLLVLQLLIVGMALFVQPVMAAMPTSFSGFFIAQANPEQDLAHIMLDLVFGVEGMFGSCIETGTPCKNLDGRELIPPDTIGGATIFGTEGWPYPVHAALHQLFTVYSLGLLVVAVIIATYFMITIVAETAQTGTAFGKRFNKVWAPIRIVVAFGLLVPISTGLNTAQYVVLYAAKFGSGFASNGWVLFNETLNQKYNDEIRKMVATPEGPEIGALLQFMFVAKTCAHAHDIMEAKLGTSNHAPVTPYLVRDPFTPAFPIQAGTTYTNLLDQLNGENLALIRFGVRNKQEYPYHKGNVSPICGEIAFALSDPRKVGAAKKDGGPPEEGPRILQEYYFTLLQELWADGAWGNGTEDYPLNYAKNYMLDNTIFSGGKAKDLTAERRSAAQSKFDVEFAEKIKEAVEAQEKSKRWEVDQDLMDKGWAAASIWYNRIAEMNGAVTTAVFKVPLPSRYPEVMEYVRQKKLQFDQNVSADTKYMPTLANGNEVPFADPMKHKAALALHNAYNAWIQDGMAASTHTAPSGNVVIDVINSFFGTDGLFNMRNNTDVHPLAQLAALGRSLVESAINNIGRAAITGGVGGVLGATVAKIFGVAAGTAANFMITFAMVGLTAGFILFYIVPFLPFIYFFFAFGGWVKGIFEAMVGAPLWALAHITIDGDGLPGKAALSGYFLIFEIFLRPILTVFGFLASILIFGAMVEVLNDIFTLVVRNVSGYEASSTVGTNPTDIEFYRSPVDEFFYTVIYAVIVYMMGMSSFKLIDNIPNNILRWMNQNVQTFGDQREDPAQGLVQFSQVGAQQGLQSMEEGLKKMSGAVSSIGR